MINVYGTYRRHLKKVTNLQSKWSLEEVIHTLEKYYSKCGLPPGADPQTVLLPVCSKSRD